MLELIHAWSDGHGDRDPGFRIVHHTTGMSERTTRTLERHSGMDLPGTGSATPVRAHRIMMLDGGLCSVLTTITQTAGSAPDRPGRTAHHLVLSPAERPTIGPVALVVSGWFREHWDEGAPPGDTPDPLPHHCELPPCPGVDPEWIRLLSRRVHAHAPTAILVPGPARCIDVLAAIERTTAPGQQWELTFLTNSDRMRDGVLLLAAQADTSPAARIAAAKEGVVLPLANPPPTRGQAHHLAEGDQLRQDRVELMPASMQLGPARLTGPVLLLIALAVAALAMVIAVLSGWTP